MNWPLRFLIPMLLAAELAIGYAIPSAATEPSAELKARQTWQLLDYVAVDYAGAVSEGAVLKATEYAEMQEFAAAAEANLREFPRNEASGRLQQQAAGLRAAIAQKAEATGVAGLAHRLAADILKAYPFPTSPTSAPDLVKGANLFQSRCASCHGSQGRGDGPLAAKLEPRPTVLTEPSRARERSLFSLYQIISNGVDGTAMASFGSLPDDERWALAFFVGTLPYSNSTKSAGENHWQTSIEARQALPDLDALAQTSERALADRLGDDPAAAITAFLRNEPRSLAINQSGGIAVAKARLAESLAALERGDRKAATRLALSAYLDGFEPVEPALAARNRSLFMKIEAAMVAYRAGVGAANIDELRVSVKALQDLLVEANLVMSPEQGDATATFFGALTILLREGLEALLVVVTMIAFLKKAERKDVLVFVHGGWLAALAAGGVTWAVATHLVSVSGASRELTEGFSSLFAALVLLSVGVWMHQKSVAGRWQVYLKQKLSAALGRRAAWFLFSLAFIAVYREVFETVLFYVALWTEGNGLPLLAGLGTGIVVLGVIAIVLLRTSAKLPLGQFFAASSLLVAVLAVVLVGKGAAALQEAGVLGIDAVPFVRIDMLGVHPSLQTLLAQAAVIVAIVVAFVLNSRPDRRDALKA